MTERPIRYATVCSGIEAPSCAVGGLTARFEAAFFSEIDAFCCALLAHRLGDVPNLGDITAEGFIARAKALGPIDALIAGTPCQAFSVAGARGSLADARGNLTLAFVEIVHALRPELALWENVPGVLSTPDNAFGCLLGGLVGSRRAIDARLCGRPDGRWPNAGMVAGSRRTACWRILDAQYFGLAQRRRRVYVVSLHPPDGANPGAILFEPEGLPGNPPPRREARAGIARSLTSSPGGASAKEQQFTFVDRANRPLNALAGDIARAVTGDGSRFGSGRDGQDTFIPGTLLATYPNVGGKALEEMDNGIIAFSGRARGAEAKANRAERPPHCMIGKTGALDTIKPWRVASEETAPRRLTPLECERLQGFPDDWTRIPYRGRPADDCADSPRYRALGNAMPIPVIRWILARWITVRTSLFSDPSVASAANKGSEGEG